MVSGVYASQTNSTVNANQGASRSGVSRHEGSIQHPVIVNALKSHVKNHSNRILPAASADARRTSPALVQRFSTLQPVNVNALTSAHPTSTKIPTHVAAFAGRSAPVLATLIERGVSVWETAHGSAQHQTATGLRVARTTVTGGAGKECHNHQVRNTTSASCYVCTYVVVNHMSPFPHQTDTFTPFPHRYFPSFPTHPCQCDCCIPKKPGSNFNCGFYTPFGRFACQYYIDPKTNTTPCKWACR